MIRLDGQENIVQAFNRYTIDSLPHSILLCGKYGSGRHSLTNMIANEFNLKQIVLDDIDGDLLQQISDMKEPVQCVIDFDNIITKKESAALKFIEEPAAHVFIVGLCTSLNNIIAPIVNRCTVFNMAEYSLDYLMSIAALNSIELPLDMYQVFNTPGKVIVADKQTTHNMFELATAVFSKIHLANIANILTISDKIDCTGKNNKLFDFSLFADILVYIAKNNMAATGNYSDYQLAVELYNKQHIQNINKQMLLDNFLYKLKATRLGDMNAH